jgi:hypothetical protein
MNFQMTPQSLGQLNSVPIDMTLQALDWQQRAEKADQMSLAEIAAQNQRAAESHKLAQETGRLNNETTLAQLPGIRATSTLNQQKARMGELTFDAEVTSKLKEFAVKAKESELKEFDMKVEEKLRSRDPAEVKEGERLFAASTAMRKLREEHKLKKELEAAQTYRTLEAARITAASREKVAAASAAIKQEALQAKTPKDWQELAVKLQGRLIGESDPALIAELQTQIVNAQTMAERLRPAPAPVIDPAVAGGALRDPRGPIPTPPASGGAKQAPGGPFTDAEKERRYQEWVKQQGQK